MQGKQNPPALYYDFKRPLQPPCAAYEQAVWANESAEARCLRWAYALPSLEPVGAAVSEV